MRQPGTLKGKIHIRDRRPMSISIRKCSSCLSNNKTTHGFVIEAELFGMLAELVFTRVR